MKNVSTGKKVLIGIIILGIIIGVIMIIVLRNSNKNTENEQIEETVQKAKTSEKVETKTFNVEGKQAKYNLLKNEDGTTYGIEFENPELMTEIAIIKRDSKKESIKDSIIDGIYKFKTDAFYKLKIETTNGISILTDAFQVVTQK